MPTPPFRPSLRTRHLRRSASWPLSVFVLAVGPGSRHPIVCGRTRLCACYPAGLPLCTALASSAPTSTTFCGTGKSEAPSDHGSLVGAGGPQRLLSTGRHRAPSGLDRPGNVCPGRRPALVPPIAGLGPGRPSCRNRRCFSGPAGAGVPPDRRRGGGDHRGLRQFPVPGPRAGLLLKSSLPGPVHQLKIGSDTGGTIACGDAQHDQRG